MNKKIKLTLMGISIICMSSCGMMNTAEYPTYPTYTYNDTEQPYNQNNYNLFHSDYSTLQKQEVTVPDSYHVGDFRSPISFKDRDQTWINSQNPQGYTIELSEGNEASKVAQVLYKAPKNDRTAQVKYERDGKVYYKGVYGTYTTAAEAQKALDTLPPEIKSSATVINWGSVQQ